MNDRVSRQPAMRVLLVEDDAADAGLVRHALRMAGGKLELHHATSLADALEWMAGNRCDVVLLDLSLPDSHGFDTIRRMRDAFAAVPLVVLTGFDDEAFAVAAMEAGTQDYLVKGVTDGAAILRAVRYAIARMNLEEKLRRSEQRLHSILTLARDAILVTDERHDVVMFNPAAERMFGCAAEEVLGGPLIRLLPEPDRAEHLAAMEAFVREAGKGNAVSRHVDAVALSRDGRPFPVEISLSPCVDHGVVLTTAVIRDVTERRKLEDELRRLATTDPLTGLCNRRLFLEEAERELERVRRYGNPAAMLMLDIDHFKRVNDTRGHAAGDAALRGVAALCREVLRTTDLVSRLGGEEFGILLPETPPEAAQDVAERLRAAIGAAAIPADAGPPVHVTVSIGITPIGRDEAVERPLARADAALYRAKRRGRNRVELEPAEACSDEEMGVGDEP